MEDDIVGMENEGFEPNPFLISLVNATPDQDEDPLMKFVLQKDDSKLPSQPKKSDYRVMDTFSETTSPQTKPAFNTSQPSTDNAAASSKKRAREPDNTRTMATPEPLNALFVTASVDAPGDEYAEAKKPKSASEKHVELNSNVSLHLSNNFQHCQQNISRGKNQTILGVDLQANGPSPLAHSLPLVDDFSQFPASQSSAVPPVVGFRVGGSELGCNEELSPFEQVPSVNPSSVASVVLSSGGISMSPFSASTFSEDDILSAATPGSSQNVQESQSHFYCANSQANIGNSSMPLEFDQLEGLGQTNGSLLGVKELNPTFSQNNETLTNICAQGNVPVLKDVRDMDSFVPRPRASSQIISGLTPYAFCKIMNPKKEYDKNQKKLLTPRRSEQRIQGGKIKMKVLTKIPLLDNAPVEVFVRREPTAARKQCHEHPDQFTMDMTRIADLKMSNIPIPDPKYSSAYKCEFDLDSVYLTVDGKEVYKLVKSKGAFNNRFQLLVYLRYVNGHEESLIPYEFVLKSGRTPTQHDHHRERDNAGFITGAADGPRAHHVSCRHLDAETAKITNILCENIQTENHDIAYFMRVQTNEGDTPSDMEKGDVVAFLEDDDGDTYIDFITSENARDARLAGVISRTAFFRGRTAICDPDHLDCDLVCIIGEVEVKVVGKVQAGDLIYTSNCEQYRGSAVARNPLEAEIQDSASENCDPTPTLLGMAMESDSDLDIKLVRCLVSIVLGISDLHQRRTLAELRKCHDKIAKIQKYLRGIWKRALLFLVFFLIVGILCYLFLAPNSPYLIMMCEKGCLENNKGSCQYLKFEYIHDEAQESDEIIGVLFTWKTLKHKLELAFDKCRNLTGYKYYLNKSRCVTGGIRAISSWLDPAPRVPRVNVFAVSPNCSLVSYYSASERHWEKYKDGKIRVNECNTRKISQ